MMMLDSEPVRTTPLQRASTYIPENIAFSSPLEESPQFQLQPKAEQSSVNGNDETLDRGGVRTNAQASTNTQAQGRYAGNYAGKPVTGLFETKPVSNENSISDITLL